MQEEINTSENDYKQAHVVKSFSGWKLRLQSLWESWELEFYWESLTHQEKNNSGKGYTQVHILLILESFKYSFHLPLRGYKLIVKCIFSLS